MHNVPSAQKLLSLNDQVELNKITQAQGENCFSKYEPVIINNYKEKTKGDKVIKAQIHDTKRSDNKTDQTELKLLNIESEQDSSDFSHLSDSSVSPRLDRKIEGYQATQNKKLVPFKGKLYNSDLIESFDFFNSANSSTVLKPKKYTPVYYPSYNKRFTNSLNIKLQELELKELSSIPFSTSNLSNLSKLRKDIQVCHTKDERKINHLNLKSLNIELSNSSINYRFHSPLERYTEGVESNSLYLETASSIATVLPHNQILLINDKYNKVKNYSNTKFHVYPNQDYDEKASKVIINTVTESIVDEVDSNTTRPLVCKTESPECFSESTSNSNTSTTQHNQTTLNKIKTSSITKSAPIETSTTNTASIKSDIVLPVNTSMNTMTDNKVTCPEKTREQIKAEREAKKAAKAAAKAKGKGAKVEVNNITNKTPTASNSAKESEKLTELPVTKEEKPSSCIDNVTKVNSDIHKNNSIGEGKDENKSKAKLRAERRAKQEAQRAAKQEILSEKSKLKAKEESRAIQDPVINDTAKSTVKKVTTKENAHEVNLFKHLYHERELALTKVPMINTNIHPTILRLGIQFANKIIVGSNARCVALLASLKHLIQDFVRPSQADFIRGLEASLQESATYLHYCRPLAVSMQNALRHLKWQMTQLPSTISDKEAKNKLRSAIDTYILEQIQLADKAISITIQTKISNGNVILTYGYSSLIHKILTDAHAAGKKFRVVVVDGRPWLEGKEQLRRLAKHGIECSYILINALSYIMPEVSKVFLGAHAILANGAVMSRVGTAQVALMARAFNVPVLVACETHKSCERVQTDSIVYNELGDADELTQNFLSNSKKSILGNWRTKKSLNLLNITYDVTPADLVTAVVTELAILPCTSVPVILRIKPSEI